MSTPHPPATDDQALLRAVRRLDGVILGVVVGLVCGLALLVATLVLVAKGGAVVGPHLSLLGHYFIGYDVTTGGAFIGFAWAFVVGFAAGWAVSWLYNLIVARRLSAS